MEAGHIVDHICQSFRELLTCKCKKRCLGRCKCHQGNQKSGFHLVGGTGGKLRPYPPPSTPNCQSPPPPHLRKLSISPPPPPPPPPKKKKKKISYCMIVTQFVFTEVFWSFQCFVQLLEPSISCPSVYSYVYITTKNS